jgi:multidrug efflux pump subunit AcrA (membrane-fusion protein)
MEIPMFSSNRSLILIPAAAAAILAGCGGKEAEKKAPSPAKPVAVTTVKLAPAKLPEVYEATGTVRARTTSVLSARLMGHIREVRVQAGDTVKAGQVVAVIDAREIETALRQAQAARNEATSAAPEVDNAIAAAKAQLDLAQATFKRMKTLYDEKSITSQEFDEVSAKLRMAEANHQMALAKREQLQAKIRQASEAIAQIEIQREYAEVKAPFDGVVVERRAEPGMLAAPGMPIAVVEQAGVYRLEAAVEESRLGKIRPGMPVTVRLDAFDREIKSTVAEVVPALDPASRTFTVKINLGAAPGIKSGLFGRALFHFGERDALAVPASALVEDGSVVRVFVVEQDRARSRMVSTGVRAGGSVEILSGLREGETVIAPRPAGLADGAPVEAAR